ncbi:alpha/beta fold hydrolase [Bradyrhizobium sp. USDA 4515]
MLVELARRNTLVRYDARGSGLSDWDVSEMSLDAWVIDLKAVVDASGLERFPLFGYSQGCAVSVAFANRYPNRVSKLILYGGFRYRTLQAAIRDRSRPRSLQCH